MQMRDETGAVGPDWYGVWCIWMFFFSDMSVNAHIIRVVQLLWIRIFPVLHCISIPDLDSLDTASCRAVKTTFPVSERVSAIRTVDTYERDTNQPIMALKLVEDNSRAMAFGERLQSAPVLGATEFSGVKTQSPEADLSV